MLLAFTVFMFCVNLVVFFMARFDLRDCASDSEVDESLERWWRIFRYVIVMNIFVNLLYFWTVYNS